MKVPRSLPLLGFAIIAACGPAPTDPGPGGVTVEEAEALDKAAEKLEAEQANPPMLPGKDESE